MQAQATAQCATDLAQLNITSRRRASYGSDKVWSYELGSKVRVLDRTAQPVRQRLRIDWDKPRDALSAAHLRVLVHPEHRQGDQPGLRHAGRLPRDVGPHVELFGRLHDAHYTETVQTVPNAQGVRSTLVFAGPGLRRHSALAGHARRALRRSTCSIITTYLTGSWQYTGKIPNSTPAGTSAYAPDAYFAPSTSYVTARVGMLFGDVDVSLFADNLTNEDALTPATLTGRATCRNADCSTFASFWPTLTNVAHRPRMIGVTAVYRR